MTYRNTRRTDPDTSLIAEVESRHRADSLVVQVAAYVRAHPGQCRYDIAEGMRITEYELSKRLSDAAERIASEHGLAPWSTAGGCEGWR